MAREVVIVGGGVRGLAAAVALAGEDAARVTLLERAPALGGVLAVEHPLVERLAAQAAHAGVRLLRETTALRYADGRVLAADGHGPLELDADALVMAGGSRPATAAELRLLGTRPAGVLPAPAAVALARDGVPLARRALVLGAGWWADAAAHTLAATGASVQRVALRGEGGSAHALELRGTPRVQALVLAHDTHVQTIECDTVVLAAGVRPLRCVEGAALGDEAGVCFLDRLDCGGPEGGGDGEQLSAERAAQYAAARARAALSRLAS